MDLYELLGIARGATLIDIKRSYKRLARKYHPDINPGDQTAEARFKEITQAYETLSDPERRLRYDAGSLSAVSASVSFEFEGFDFSSGVPLVRRAHVRGSVRGSVLAEAGHATSRAGARCRSSCIGLADLRRGDAWHAAADDADSPRHVPVVSWGRPAENRRVAMPALSGQRSSALAPREHGVFKKL